MESKPMKNMKKKDKMNVPESKGPVPTILKVKDLEEDSRFAGIHDHLPKMPCLALLIGSVRSGKSNLLVNFFCNDSFYKGMFDTVRIISTTLGTDNKGQLLNEYFDCDDHYEDYMIDAIKQEQSMYPRDERPSYALVLDDVLTQDFSKSNGVSFFATRFRHYCDFYCIATQSFRAVSGLIRNNANAIFICRQQNQKELFKIGEEYGDTVGGMDNFIKLYKEIHKIPYQVMYLDLQSNPARVLRNFEEVLWQGDESESPDLG